MTTPVHGSHVQPSDIAEILPFMTTERITVTQVSILTAKVIHRWVAPADGILEDGWFMCVTCGTGAGPNTMDIQKNGSTMLSAVMSIAHDVADGTEVKAVWLTDHTVSEGDVITLLPGAGATVQEGASAGYTFRLLGR